MASSEMLSVRSSSPSTFWFVAVGASLMGLILMFSVAGWEVRSASAAVNVKLSLPLKFVLGV